jgi:hypothetical protein
MEFNQPHETGKDKQNKWTEIISALSTLALFFYALLNHAKLWLLILSTILIVVLTLIIVRDLGLFTWIGKLYSARRQIKNGNRLARQEFRKFVLLIEKMKIAQELASELDRTEWINQENYTYFGNVHFGNWYTGIKEEAEKLRINHLIEMKLIAQQLRDYLIAFNGYYIQTMSTAYKLGRAKYSNEDYKKKIVQLKRQYDSALTEYDDFCKAFNSRCKSDVLIPVFNMPPDLDWKAGDK